MQQIATAFVKAQKAFAPALKTATIGHLNRKYADLANCIEAVIDALNANGIALVQRTHDSDNGVAVETLLVHESGETMSGGILHVPASKHDPQGYGSALTYARRYSLMAACGIAPEDDDAETAMKTAPKPVPRKEAKQEPQEPPPLKTKEQIAVMIAEANNLSALGYIWAGLTAEERNLAKEMFSIRKRELSK